MSNGPNGLTVLLDGAFRPPALAGSVIFEGATEQEARALLQVGLPEALVVDPSIPWHRHLAQEAQARGAAVVAVGADPPPPSLADEWVKPSSDGAEVASRLELAAARARLRRRQLRHAHTDPLTGLSNRRGLLSGARQLVAHARRTGQGLGLVLIDLDDLKQVNDRQGHPAGDRLLRTVGEVLHRVARRDEVCGRVGGDEFAVLLTGEALEIRRGRDRIVEALRAAGVSASAGFAAGPPWRSLEDLYDEADSALRGAKQRLHRSLRLPPGFRNRSPNKEGLSENRLNLA